MSSDKKRKHDVLDRSSQPPDSPTVRHNASEVVAPLSRSLPSEVSTAGGPTIVVHQPDLDAQNKASALLPAHLNQDPPQPQSISQWSSMSQPSSDVDQSSASTTRSGSPVGDVAIPETVTYTLHITFEKEDVPVLGNSGSIRLYDASDYQKFKQFAENCVKQHCEPALVGRSLNFRIGDCTIVGDNDEKQVQALSTQEDWVDICTVLMNFWNSNKHQHQHLHITRDYFGLLTKRTSDKSFATLKKMEMYELMKEAFDTRRYIPRTDLMTITSKDMVRQIILEDPAIESEQETFINEVLRRARKLLATCVYAGLGMRCLKHLLDKGHDDNNLPSQPLENKHRCHKKCGPQFETLVLVQGGFYAAEFWRAGEHQALHNRTVMPLHYHPFDHHNDSVRSGARETTSEFEDRELDDEENLTKQLACCGSGAYSNVYRVRLDPEHHRLSKDKNMDFAVKIFKDRPLRTGNDFKKELKILDELRNYPHEHIVTHLATWTQDGRYYMLFSFAECNLRQYMRRVAFGNPTKKSILWLLSQFRGLANALKEIHNLSSAEKADGSSPNLLAPVKDLRKSGWHHDLKPENILFFKIPSSSGGAFYVADFGSGKVHTYRSGSINTKSPNGTMTYEPPEFAKEGVTSRPYDVWSMGCVFLELLVWAVFGYSSVRTFTNDREQRRFPGSQTDVLVDDAFWQMDENRDLTLRESVANWISKLHDEIQQQRLEPFEKVLKLVIRMLDTERRDRISALDLWDTLDRTHKQATVDMKNLKQDSLPAEVEMDPESSQPLLRLSTNAPDRRTPEPGSPALTNRSDTYPQQATLYGGGLLTASPIATSSTIRRNSATSNLSSRSRGLSDASMRGQDGNSPSRTPDSTSSINEFWEADFLGLQADDIAAVWKSRAVNQDEDVGGCSGSVLNAHPGPGDWHWDSEDLPIEEDRHNATGVNYIKLPKALPPDLTTSAWLGAEGILGLVWGGGQWFLNGEAYHAVTRDGMNGRVLPDWAQPSTLMKRKVRSDFQEKTVFAQRPSKSMYPTVVEVEGSNYTNGGRNDLNYRDQNGMLLNLTALAVPWEEDI